MGDIPKPNFFIIGSAKCGTTTLADVLAEHPDCCLSRPKEVLYFSRDENFEKGWSWYQQAFSHYNQEPLIGEATPNYTARPSTPDCAKRIHEFAPDAKIVFIVRHPYKRLISGWKMHVFNHNIEAHPYAKEGFETYLRETQEKFFYVDHSRFFYQITPYLEHFGEEQVLVLFLEDWSINPREESRKLCEFLGLDPDVLPANFDRVSNRADQRNQTRGLFRVLGQSKLLQPIRRLVPQSLRKKLLYSMGTKPFVYPPCEISEDYKREVLEYLKKDAELFLPRFGKPATFWDFENV